MSVRLELGINARDHLPCLLFVGAKYGAQSFSIFMIGGVPDFTAQIATDFANTECCLPMML